MISNKTAVQCFMSGGASGGPNIEDFDDGTGIGTIVAVNQLFDGERGNVAFYLFSQSLRDGFSSVLHHTAEKIMPVQNFT